MKSDQKKNNFEISGGSTCEELAVIAQKISLIITARVDPLTSILSVLAKSCQILTTSWQPWIQWQDRVSMGRHVCRCTCTQSPKPRLFGHPRNYRHHYRTMEAQEVSRIDNGYLFQTVALKCVPMYAFEVDMNVFRINLFVCTSIMLCICV